MKECDAVIFAAGSGGSTGADKILEASSLNYTIVRPGGLLLNEPGTGKIASAENLSRGSIPREDVARTVIAVLSEENT